MPESRTSPTPFPLEKSAIIQFAASAAGPGNVSSEKRSLFSVHKSDLSNYTQPCRSPVVSFPHAPMAKRSRNSASRLSPPFSSRESRVTIPIGHKKRNSPDKFPAGLLGLRIFLALEESGDRGRPREPKVRGSRRASRPIKSDRTQRKCVPIFPSPRTRRTNPSRGLQRSLTDGESPPCYFLLRPKAQVHLPAPL